MSFRCSAVVLASLFWVMSCGSKGDSGLPGISLASINDPANAEYKIGEPVEFEFHVRAVDISAVNIPVHFSMIHIDNANHLDDNHEAETYHLGDYLMPAVTNGTNTFLASFHVPHEIQEAGRYLIVAYIDPGRAALPDDVNPTQHYSKGYLEGNTDQFGHINLNQESYHDYHLTEVTFNRPFMVFPNPATGSESETNAPTKKESDMTGHLYITKTGRNDGQATLTANVVVADQTYQVHFWDTTNPDVTQRTYGTAHTYKFEVNSEPHYFSYDIAFNGELIHKLHQAFNADAAENTFKIQFTVADTGTYEEDVVDNNTYEFTVPYRFYSPETDSLPEGLPTEPAQLVPSASPLNTKSISFNKSYGNTYGDKKKVALDIDFSAKNSISSSKYTAVFDNSGEMAFYIFNNKAEIFTTKAKAFAYASTAYAGYEVLVSVLGNSVISSSNNSYDALSKSWDKTWSEDVTLFTSTFVVAIVPVKVSAGLEGSMGFGAAFTFGGPKNLEATGTIFEASLNATASASINLLVASGGVKAEFLIVSESLSLTGTADLSKAASEKKISLNLNLSNTLEAISGNFYVFVKYPVYKWCCKIKKKEKDWTIYKTGTLFSKTWTLLDKNYTLTF